MLQSLKWSAQILEGLWGAALLALVMLTLALPCLGQYTTAVINGTVRDATGAAIPGASVTLQNVETSIERSTVTNETGIYVFVEIQPGNYDVTVEKQGFETSVRTGITLTVNENTTYDFALALGTTRQVVTVKANAAALQTASAELGNVVRFKDGSLFYMPMRWVARHHM